MDVVVVGWFDDMHMRGGVETTFSRLAKALKAKLVSYESAIKTLNIKPISERYYRFAVIDRAYYLAMYLRQYEKIFGTDVIIADDCTLAYYTPQAKLVTVAQNPYLHIADILRRDGFYNLHEYIEFGRVYVDYQATQYKKSDAVVAVSKYMHDYVSDLGYASTVINHGVDVKLFKPMDKDDLREKYGILDDKPVGLFVTKFHPVKGYDIQQRMAREVKDVHWIFCFAHQFQARVKLPNVSVFAEVEYARMPEIYNLADFVVCPSRCEAFNLVPVEAAACNVPIVTTRTGYFFYEEIGKREYGWVVNTYEDLKGVIRSMDDFKPRKWVLENKLTEERWINEWKRALRNIL